GTIHIRPGCGLPQAVCGDLLPAANDDPAGRACASILLPSAGGPGEEPTGSSTASATLVVPAARSARSRLGSETRRQSNALRWGRRGGRVAEFCRRAGLPGLEARRSCRENTCYRPHAHDSFSIGAVDTGSSVLTGPLDGKTRLEPGDVIVIPAGQVHACNPDHGQWRYQMIHVDQDWATRLMPGRISSPLLDGIRVLRHPDLHSRVSALNDAIFTDGTLEAITSQFALLFTELEGAAPEHAAATESDPDLLIRLAPVLQRLRADLANPARSARNLCRTGARRMRRISSSVRCAVPPGSLRWHGDRTPASSERGICCDRADRSPRLRTCLAFPTRATSIASSAHMSLLHPAPTGSEARTYKTMDPAPRMLDRLTVIHQGEIWNSFSRSPRPTSWHC